MTRTFDITPLRSLVAVATTGGVHRAAQSLLLTQSAVSQHLRRLEREAGAPLVRKEGRRLGFTADGEQLLAHARAILAAHDAAVHHFDKDAESVVVGSAQNSAAVALPVVMARLRELLPEVDVRFHLDRNTTVRQMLDRGDVDVAVSTRVAPEIRPRPGGFRLRWLWSGPTAPDPEAEVPLVVFSTPCTLRQPSFDSWSTAGRRWRVVAEVNDLASALDLVRGGASTMLVPVLDRLPDGLRELPGAPEVPAIQMVVVRTDRTPAAVTSAVAEILDGEVGSERVEVLDHSALPMP